MRARLADQGGENFEFGGRQADGLFGKLGFVARAVEGHISGAGMISLVGSPLARRSTTRTRAASSRGLNGLVM